MGKYKNQFKAIVPYPNFMTPHVITYKKIKGGVAELSYGKGLRKDDMYGVTCVINNEHDHDKSQVFRNKQEALDYIETLQ